MENIQLCGAATINVSQVTLDSLRRDTSAFGRHDSVEELNFDNAIFDLEEMATWDEYQVAMFWEILSEVDTQLNEAWAQENDVRYIDFYVGD